MITERFSQVFSRLLNRWADYQDAPRDPAHVADLAAARIALDKARGEIAQERALVSVAPAAPANTRRVAVSDSDLMKLRIAALGMDGSA